MPSKHMVLSTLMAVAVALFLAASPGVHAGLKKSDSKARVTATATKPDATGKQVVTITFAIDRGWHIYANPVGNPDFEDNHTEIKVKTGGKSDVKVAYPPGKAYEDMGIRVRIYEGDVTIRATVQRAAGDKTPLEVSVRFNACDDKGCLPPATLKLVPKVK